MAINRRVQPLSTPHKKSETLYHGRVLHLHLLSISLYLKALHSASSKFFSQNPCRPHSSPLFKSHDSQRSSHQAIPSSIVTSNVFSLASQQSFLQPQNQANVWEGTGEVLQAQLTL